MSSFQTGKKLNPFIVVIFVTCVASVFAHLVEENVVGGEAQYFVEPADALGSYIVDGPRNFVGDPHERAYQAYFDAAQGAECLLAPELLAGVGFVESRHGTIFGSEVNPFGNVAPRITGPALDGDGVLLIEDSDGGLFDGDTVFDRAVGPMQFIPDSWGRFGEGNPNNIDDAARAAANHLCSTNLSGDLVRSHDDMRAALRDYNNSDEYFWAVMEAATYYGEIGLFDVRSF